MTILPKGWTMVALGDVCEIVSGATPKTSVESYWGGPIRWATPKDLSDLGERRYLIDTPRTLTEDGLRSCGARILPAGSVLFSSRAPVGLTAINTVPVATNQGFKSLVPSPNVDAEYLYWWLSANRQRMEYLGRGATFKEVSKAIVAEVSVPLPPLEEQRRIAAILDKADELRAKRRAALEQLDSLAQAIFLDMFDRKREVGWPISRLGNLADVQGGLQVSRKRASLPLEVPYLRVANVHRGRLDLSEVKTMRATDAELRRVALERDDLLVVEGHGNAAEIGRVARWDACIETCVHQNHLIRVRANASVVEPAYLEIALNSGEPLRQLRRAGRTTSGLNTLSTNDVRSVSVVVPPAELQREFVRCRRELTKQIDAGHRSQTELDALFASLQSRAFRGEL